LYGLRHIDVREQDAAPNDHKPATALIIRRQSIDGRSYDAEHLASAAFLSVQKQHFAETATFVNQFMEVQTLPRSFEGSVENP
jgi:hypothetical protein